MGEAQIAPRVSVLIVSYNRAEALRRCLASIELSAGRDAIEILVIDNGSRDESPGLDAEFPNTTFLRLPRNFGFTKAVNIGMRTAKADFFLFLDPLVEVLPKTIASLAAGLEAEPGAAGVCPLLAAPDGEPVPQLYRLPSSGTIASVAHAGEYLPAPAPDLTQEKIAVDFPSLAALLVRSYFLRGLRYIDERYAQSWAGAEVAAQIRRAAKKIYLLPATRAVRHDDSDFLASLPADARALLSADWALGAAVYAGKHFGFLAGLKLRLGVVFAALGQAILALLRFRDIGYRFSRFGYLLRGQKIDGTQAVM